ncbi:GDSL lipase/esterase [Arabidopsis thaliana x Arabidopsis arenosa]|uniref:GDSL lipase/esterase n=1 Tax=Arabidopsis thaliana x Arabidopsis arenosa TaxID=1240361 RepID=A0A8T2CA80_9BRAS|nr:GDSL lipase/esterase [Arabidopsis thaliana x Arabidopsis arenosa]
MRESTLMEKVTRRTISFSSSFIFFIFSSTIIFLAGKSSAKFSHDGDNNVTALFLFGDSFLDAGNNNYINTTTLDQANFPPYGQTFFGLPTGRFSDGRLISDFIAEYANLPLIPPFLEPGNSQKKLYGVNFASAGAGALVETFQGSVINLRTQLDHYKKVERLWRTKFGKEESKKRISRAVYLISIGSNDYSSLFLTNQSLSISMSQHVDIVIGNLTTFIHEIYKIGGRKFGFLNVPDLGCFPALRILQPNNDSCLRDASRLANMHNRALANLLFKMQRQVKGFKFSLFDMNKSLRVRMQHPSKFGFKEWEEACCGTGKWRGVFSCGGKRIVKEYKLCENPKDYIFWDSLHLTQNTYNQFANLIWNGGHKSDSLVVGPYNINKLFQIP